MKVILCKGIPIEVVNFFYFVEKKEIHGRLATIVKNGTILYSRRSHQRQRIKSIIDFTAKIVEDAEKDGNRD